VLTQALGPNQKALAAPVVNTGEIVAQGGVVQLSANAARSVVGSVINMSGVVRADAAVTSPLGVVRL